MHTLVTIATDRVRLTWSGPPAAGRGARPLAVTPADGVQVVLDGAEAETAEVWLEEETAYPVLLQSLGNEPVHLRHSDPVVTGGLVSGDDGRVLHGRVQFGSQAGRTAFDIVVGSTVEMSVSVSVLPAKMSEAEVAVMRAEAEAFAAGLAVSAVRPTTIGDRGGDLGSSPPVWLAALRTGVDHLERALRHIRRRPVLDVHRVVENVRLGRVSRPSLETLRAARKRGVSDAPLPVRSPRLSSDTPAHRWLAARLRAHAQTLRRLERAEAGRPASVRRRALLEELGSLRTRVEAVRAVPILRDAGARAPTVPPLVLRRRPGYADAYDALRRLDRGLALRDGALDVATQDLAVLYETWAVLAVVQALADVLGVEPPERPFGVDVRGTDVRLRRGAANAVRLSGRGVEATAVYTPRFPAPPALLAQRPDVVIDLRRGTERTRVVLDAKYRRDDSAGYRRRYGAAGPPEDALNTLHRYRDAVPGVAVAAALFPGTSEGFEGSRLWTSLSGLGVGAVPFRPGDRGGLTRFLSGLV